MASRWEMLASLIACSDLEDSPFKDDLIAVMRVCHGADSFMEQAHADGVLAISMPEVTDLIYDALSDGWNTMQFPPSEPSRREENSSPDAPHPAAVTDPLAAEAPDN